MSLLQDAYENQWRGGVEIRPGWKHCSRMVCGRLNGTRLVLHRCNPVMNSPTLYADIFIHERGSVVVGEFKLGARVFFWGFRAFLSLLFFGVIVVLLWGKLRSPESLSTLGLSLSIAGLVGICLVLMYGLKRIFSLSMDDVDFVRHFIEEATSESRAQVDRPLL